MHLLCFQFQSNSTVEPILPSFITNFPPPQGETWLPLPSTYLLTYSDPENTESTFKIAHLQWKANLLITRIKYLLTVFFSNAYIIFSWFALCFGKITSREEVEYSGNLRAGGSESGLFLLLTHMTMDK